MTVADRLRHVDEQLAAVEKALGEARAHGERVGVAICEQRWDELTAERDRLVALLPTQREG